MSSEHAAPASSAGAAAEPAADESAVAGECDDDIPEDWGWPKEPYGPEYLKDFVLTATQPTQQEKWDEQLELRTADTKLEDFVAEKAFANLMLDKEGTRDVKEGKAYEGIDPNAYRRGRWYRFLNHKGDCYVYVHNYTRDITASRPENFKDLTDEEKKRLAKLGVYIKELPNELDHIYNVQKKIPIVYASQETCEALKPFFVYAKDYQLLDATKLKRISSSALEECRKAIVAALKDGKMLAVYCGDVVPEFLEKVCASKNKEFFPSAVFRYGGLENDLVREKIYKPEDREANMCVMRPGFSVCIVVMYDTMSFEFSSMRKEELPQKIPDFEHMAEIRTYNDDDKQKLLDLMRA